VWGGEVPHIAFINPLSETDFIRVEFVKERNKILDLRIIYFTEIDGKRYEIVRFDCSHDFLHKDILFEKRKIKEAIHRELSPKLVESLIAEIKQDWREMKRLYLKKLRMEGDKND